MASLAAVMRKIGEHCEYPELVRIRRAVLDAYAIQRERVSKDDLTFVDPDEIAGHVLKMLNGGEFLHDILEMDGNDLLRAVRGD